MTCVGCAGRVGSWSVWTADGSRVDGVTAQDWDALPADGVIVVRLHYTDGGGRVMSGSDYYFRAEGPADAIYAQTDEPPSVIVSRYPTAVVKRGAWTDDATMHAAVMAAS